MSDAASKEAPRTSELWKSLTSDANRPTKLVTFPRPMAGAKSNKLIMRVCTVADQVAAAAAANQTARKLLKESAGEKDLSYERLFTDAFVSEVLWRACRDEADPRYPAFPDPRRTMAELTTEESAKLFDEYQLACIELGPRREFLSYEETNDDSEK